MTLLFFFSRPADRERDCWLCKFLSPKYIILDIKTRLSRHVYKYLEREPNNEFSASTAVIDVSSNIFLISLSLARCVRIHHQKSLRIYSRVSQLSLSAFSLFKIYIICIAGHIYTYTDYVHPRVAANLPSLCATQWPRVTSYILFLNITRFYKIPRISKCCSCHSSV